MDLPSLVIGAYSLCTVILGPCLTSYRVSQDNGYPCYDQALLRSSDHPYTLHEPSDVLFYPRRNLPHALPLHVPSNLAASSPIHSHH